MPEPYVLKLLRYDNGPGMFFDSWGAGLTENLDKARRFPKDWEAIEVQDAFFESRGVGLFMCRESGAKEA